MNAIVRGGATSEVERLERALALMAYIISLDGAVYAPLFDRLERELALARHTASTVARAKAMLDGFKGIEWAAAEIAEEYAGVRGYGVAK